MNNNQLTNREKLFAQAWYLPVVDAIRSRMLTIIVTAIVSVAGTIFAFSPQLSTLTGKVGAIESNYVTKEDFDNYIENQKIRWTSQDSKLDLIIQLSSPQKSIP
jgi:hypothetical protein